MLPYSPFVLLALSAAVNLYGWIFGQTEAAPEFAWIERGGIIGALFLGIVGFMREWWVPGPTHRRTEAERARLALLVESTIPVMTRLSDFLASRTGRKGGE